MLRLIPSLTLGLALTLAACAGDDSGDTGNNASTGSDTTADPGTTTNNQVDSTADPGTTTNDPGTTTDDPGTTTDDPGTTTEQGSTTEDPGSTGEQDACGMCVEAMCAAELAECLMDPDCTCFQECAATNPGMAGAIACAGQCNIPLPDLLSDMTIVGRLANCTTDNCPKCL